jgi:hypothetical protein
MIVMGGGMYGPRKHSVPFFFFLYTFLHSERGKWD